jgi:hypothetical protein
MHTASILYLNLYINYLQSWLLDSALDGRVHVVEIQRVSVASYLFFPNLLNSTVYFKLSNINVPASFLSLLS